MRQPPPASRRSDEPRRRVAIMLDLEWPYRRHFDVLVGTQNYAQAHGHWDCVLDEFAAVTLAETRSNPAYDGVIARATPELLRNAARARVPVVNVWYNSLVTPSLPGVFPDFARSGAQAAEHFLERGFRRFACVSGGDRAQNLEIDAFHAVLKERGFECNCMQISRQYSRNKRVWKRFKETIDAHVASWQPPVGIYVTFPDVTGRHIAESIRQHGLAIPEQAAIIVNENDPVLCMHPPPALTSVDIPFAAIGRKAAEMLDQLMDGKELEQQHIFVEPASITARQSTDFLAVDDETVAAALRCISRRAHQSLGVDDVCSEICIGRRTLERRFRGILGRSVAEEIQRLRLERAKRELAHGGTPVKQVARLAGFKDSKRLHEVFLRELGESPSQFRRRLQTKA